MRRRRSRQVKVGGLCIGGGAPISVQGMCKSPSNDAAALVAEVERLQAAGADAVRLAVPDRESVEVFASVRRRARVPLIADVHFDYRLAEAALDAGADKLRINPGNIGGKERLAEVARQAAERGIPIRIGVNSGSLERPILERYGGPTAEAMAESALAAGRTAESSGARSIVLSLKSSDPRTTIEAYRIAARSSDYPLHVGVTATGTARRGTVRSSLAIGVLLSEGIGDTMRVSLTADSTEEVLVAREILRSMGLDRPGPELISCPTCGRCRVALQEVAERVERELLSMEKPVKVAVMGCVVNGPGEAREADVGLAAGRGSAAIFRNGRIVRTVPEERMVEELLREIELAAAHL